MNNQNQTQQSSMTQRRLKYRELAIAQIVERKIEQMEVDEFHQVVVDSLTENLYTYPSDPIDGDDPLIQIAESLGLSPDITE